MFHGKNGCDCKDKTYSNCYLLKYQWIYLSDTLNPLKHICTATNCTTIGTFTLCVFSWHVFPIKNLLTFYSASHGIFVFFFLIFFSRPGFASCFLIELAANFSQNSIVERFLVGMLFSWTKVSVYIRWAYGVLSHQYINTQFDGLLHSKI